MPRATFYCIDIECSGPVPHTYDMVSLGAVVVRGTAPDLTLGERFYVEICPTSGRVDAQAMAVNGLDLDHLKATGLPMARALSDLNSFVSKTCDPQSTPVFVGHNAPFDWSFVRYAYHTEGLDNPFGYKALDTKALAMGVLGLHWLDTSKEVLQSRLDLPDQDAEQTHRADYDAWYQALILIELLRRSPACAAS